MRVLWFTWKDGGHPGAGGAEAVNEELAKRLVASGHEVRFVVGGFAGAEKRVGRDGYEIVRLGNRWTAYWHAWRHYVRHLRGWADVVVDEVNTLPFFCRFYVREPSVLFVHQLCREIWFYQMRFPLSAIGYLMEPICLWALRRSAAVVVSESTRKDLMRFGFRGERITVIPQGLTVVPVPDVAGIEKSAAPTVLSLGSVRPMKRTAHVVAAFEEAKRHVPDLRLIVAGDMGGSYGRKVSRMIAGSRYADSITRAGKITESEKVGLMRRALVLCVTSVKEGWGLVVSEANSQGTPAVVYDVDGLRDSVRNGETGIVTGRNDSGELAAAIVRMCLDKEGYSRLRTRAWERSREMSFDRSHEAFERTLNAL